jgi:hypothetical protein
MSHPQAVHLSEPELAYHLSSIAILFNRRMRAAAGRVATIVSGKIIPEPWSSMSIEVPVVTNAPNRLTATKLALKERLMLSGLL